MNPSILTEWGPVLVPALAAASLVIQRRPRDRWVVTLTSIAFLAHAARYWSFTVDDAFITFRFARSWVDGLGPVYQGGARVEGVTSFGWLALLALAGRMGAHVETAAKLLGLASAVGALLAVHALARRVSGSPRVAFAATALLALDPLFAAWSVAGMETPLFAALIAWAVWAHVEGRAIRGVPLAPALFGLSVWTRPEGFLFGTLAWLTLAASRRPDAMRDAARWALVATAFALPFWIWRWSYYGAFFPNTFYAKLPDLSLRLAAGTSALRDYVLETGPIAWLPPVASLARLRTTHAPERLLWLLVAAFFGYVAWSGGDVLHLRFFVHVLPLVAVLWASGMATLLEPAGDREPAAVRSPAAPRPAGLPRAAVLATALTLVTAASGLAAARHDRATTQRAQFGPGYVVNNSRNIREVNLPLGEWLHANAPAGSTLATWDIGGVGWTSGLPILDLYGLTDAALARMIHDRAPVQRRIDYVLAARPELLATYARVDGPDWSWLAPAADSLERGYSLHSVWRAQSSGYWLALFRRNDVLLPRLAADTATEPAER